MECFSYEGGCGIHISRHLKEVLAWVVVKYFQFSNNLRIMHLCIYKQSLICCYVALQPKILFVAFDHHYHKLPNQLLIFKPGTHLAS